MFDRFGPVFIILIIKKTWLKIGFFVYNGSLDFIITSMSRGGNIDLHECHISVLYVSASSYKAITFFW